MNDATVQCRPNGRRVVGVTWDIVFLGGVLVVVFSSATSNGSEATLLCQPFIFWVTQLINLWLNNVYFWQDFDLPEFHKLTLKNMIDNQGSCCGSATWYTLYLRVLDSLCFSDNLFTVLVSWFCNHAAALNRELLLRSSLIKYVGFSTSMSWVYFGVLMVFLPPLTNVVLTF